MRTLTWFLAVLVVACVGLMPIGAVAAPATEAKVGLGIEKLDITGASDTFKIAPDTKVYGWARVTDVAPNSSVSIVFKKGDKEVYKKDVSIPSVPYRINAYRTFRSADSGEWTLSIVGPDAKELVSTTFKVEITK